jgi:flagellar M-ring protein FliF
MRAFLSELGTQLRGIWSRLDGGQRLVVVAVLTATLVGLGAMVWFAGRPSYESVFTSAEPDAVLQAQQALGKAGISFVPDASGQTITVERSRVGAAQMAIRGAGLHTRGEVTVGGTTSIIEDSETKAWKLDAASRAAAAAAIEGLDGVVSATVTASRPRRTAAFRERDREARASATVALRLKAMTAFDPIARHAASLCSSQLMIPLENIEIVSATGNQRWRYDPDREAGGGTSEFLVMQRALGDERTRLAQDRLDTMWPGKTSVMVNVELDPSWEITSQKVLPTEPILKSQKSSKDSTENAPGKPAEGDSGTAEAAAKNTSKNEMRDAEYVTEIGERRSGKSAYDVRRLTAAVLYDRSLEKTEGFNKDELVKAVKAIIGWDKGRDSDDDFSTLASDFAPVELDDLGGAGPGIGELALRWGPTVGQVLGVIVVVMFLRGLFRRPAGAGPVGAFGGGGGGATGGGRGDGARGDKEENLSPEEQQRKMRREIEKSISNDPAALAKLLEAWLTEQKA